MKTTTSFPPSQKFHVLQICSMYLGRGKTMHWRSVHLHLRLLSQVHGVHLHQNLYSSKPVLAYMHTYIHPHTHTWTLVQSWLGVGPTMGQSDPCFCHNLCHIEGPADPKGPWQIESSHSPLFGNGRGGLVGGLSKSTPLSLLLCFP